MKTKTFIFILLLPVLFLLPMERAYYHHDLSVVIEPDTQMLRVSDRITLPHHVTPASPIRFTLHGNLQITGHSPNVEVKELPQIDMESPRATGDETAVRPVAIPLKEYEIVFSGGEKIRTFHISYVGRINHPVEALNEEYARGFSSTPGIICDRGVYLAGSSHWIPGFGDNLETFRMTTEFPSPWRSVTQGKRIETNETADTWTATWDSPEPMDEIYLVAGRFTEYKQSIGGISVYAFLQKPDPGLAQKYIQTTGQYLDMYNRLIGSYAYPKFALVENFWETGYGMPSFTLLGPKVIRFPFILHSSYPHELLHNWWGTGVFLKQTGGNWCEGLTVFLADHLIKEQRNQGADYRRTNLQQFGDYVNEKNDFPLTEFKERHNASSSAIGYGKSMMVFHMLRKDLGDEACVAALRKFYQDNRFRRAGFDDLRQAFESVGKKDLSAFFEQWIGRSGAPELKLSKVSSKKKKNGYQLSFKVSQIQKSPRYRLQIPVSIYLQGEAGVTKKTISLTKKKQHYGMLLPAKPQRIEVDPLFDVFRRLDAMEVPPSLSKIFGAKRVLVLLPGSADKDLLNGYRELAKTWAKSESIDMEIETDSEMAGLPKDRPVWILGWENRFKSKITASLKPHGVDFSPAGVQVKGTRLQNSEHSIILATRLPGNPSQVMVFLSTNMAEALTGLARKLPHYGKYSYLGFTGGEPQNMLKGRWRAIHSPLAASLGSGPATASSVEYKPPREIPLATLPSPFSEDNMLEAIRTLSSPELAGRGLGTQGLKTAAGYIADEFKKAGLKPGNPGNYFQTWHIPHPEDKRPLELINVVAQLPGTDPDLKDQPVVLCAHYDHLGRGWPDVHSGDEGKIHPGADDNASGVSVLLELARHLASSANPARPVLFIAFTAEEAGLRGSKYFLDNFKGEIFSAVNLDTVGRLHDKKILVLGGDSAREWRFIFMGVGYTTGVESNLVTQDLDASDQVNFTRRGIPAIQLFSGPHTDYHRPSDTVDKIDGGGLVKVAQVAREVILYLADRKEPLSVKSSEGQPTQQKPASGGRRVKTGITPDFSFSGEGVGIYAVSDNSPAQKAGIQKGDILLKVGDRPVKSLREYAAILREYKPGDTVTFVIKRDGAEVIVHLVLTAR